MKGLLLIILALGAVEYELPTSREEAIKQAPCDQERPVVISWLHPKLKQVVIQSVDNPCYLTGDVYWFGSAEDLTDDKDHVDALRFEGTPWPCGKETRGVWEYLMGIPAKCKILETTNE